MPRPLTRSICTVAATLFALHVQSDAADIAAAPEGQSGLKPAERSAEPKLQAASDEPIKAMKKFRLLDGFSTELWAAEPMLGNPVSFSIDEKGRLFVAETYRYRTSTLDIRHYMFMLEDDLACRTTDDRIASIKKNFPTDWQKLEVETEVVRLLEDRDGDGKADFSAPYASGMNTLLDGINAGVLAHDGKVWCTNMPNLWLFSGTDKEGKAEKRESLSFGYGVRFSFTGHDMHGLIFGPDGRLYFSFGDRGAHVKTAEGKILAFSDEGAVFRCEPDGSHLEAFARGLRNPQELAFDNHGNLFTADNDSDQGDRERWAYLVEGSDSGWRIGWQHNPLGKERNSWLNEKLWEPRVPGTPFYVLSPILNIPDGPSGIAHYPGTGLPTEFADRFFICGFKGSSARSAISMLQVKESGAGFSVVLEPTTFIGDVQATDVEFGPDSKVYFSEWGEGWEGTGRGRIFRMEHAQAQKEQAAQIAEVKQLLGEGFNQRSSDELVKLLAHSDQRIRLHAQSALATKSDAAKKFLAAATNTKTAPLARLHSIWGLGQIARLAGYKSAPAQVKILSPLLPLLSDKDPEVRAQVAKVCGDGQVDLAFKPLLAALKDENLRARFFATQSLGKLGKAQAAEPILSMIRENADKDEFLRHAGVVALVGIHNEKALAVAAKDSSASVRLAALLVMRRNGDANVAQFLSDSDPLLVKEAAHAINDEGITGAYAALGKLLLHPSTDEQLMIRVINAAYRSGSAEAAEALSNYAADEAAPEALRLEALKQMAAWPNPPARDRVVGIFRPLDSREKSAAVASLKTHLPQLLAAKSSSIVSAALEATTGLEIKEAAPALFELAINPATAASIRAKALQGLAAFNDPKLKEALTSALADKDAGLRVTAITLLGKLNPDEAAQQLSAAFAGAKISEKKPILTALGDLKSTGADTALAALLLELKSGKIAPEVQLELLEAAAKRQAPSVKTQLADYQGSLPKNDPLATYGATLVGGNKAAGEKLFKEHAVAACLRCHKVKGTGGDAGPDLTGIASRKDRHYILESLIVPGAQIAEGFQSVLVTLKNGEMQVGVIKKETESELTLQMPVPGVPPVTVKKAEVKSRENAPSGMPPNMGDLLSKREVRDLIEYVASLK